MTSCTTMSVWTVMPAKPLTSANPGERENILIIFRLPLKGCYGEVQHNSLPVGGRNPHH